MAGYNDDDQGGQPDPMAEVTDLVYKAGYADAVMEAERANSDDAWGDRIVAAAKAQRVTPFGDGWGDDDSEEYEEDEFE